MLYSQIPTDGPWFRSYPQGVPHHPELSGHAVHEMLSNAAEQWPDRIAVDFMGHQFSYAELDNMVSRAAKGLQKLGVKPGVHVGLYLPNTPHCVISFLAIMRAGGVVVNYSPLDAERILEHKIADSETDLMITVDLQALLPQMTRFIGNSRLKGLIVGSLEDFASAGEECHNALTAAGGRASVPAEGTTRFTDLLNNDGDYAFYPESIAPDSLAALQYTGGTTGAPKGAMLTHRTLSSATDQLKSGSVTTLVPGEERLLSVLPPFHIYSIVVNTLAGISNGATLYLQIRFDPKQALEAIHNEQITIFAAVPTMFSALLAYPELHNYRLDSLKLCNSGGAPLPVQLQQHFKEKSGCTIKEGWGMTETASIGTFTPEGLTPPPGSCGIAVPGVDIRILSLDGEEELPAGERGELCCRGPNMMSGYWKREDATKESTTSEGFYRTGDIAYLDENGFLFIVDRTKDMIICSGYNVYPRNIEEAIHEHPAVSEVSVIGAPDEYRGQSPRAYITLVPGEPEPTLEEMQAFLRSRLGKHEMIHGMEIRTELPKTPVGKLSKKELYAEVNAG
ncbi:long-chain fatty acid--CoA ligase [Marinobacter sp.]|uniref:long-chain-fatty-acid--CoA ligase n=1 Tax=Marinobacter sp. TaxID=50741 RepID=UPI002B26B3A9|nr:long-chain fatty acid--CoA ligase [Marinobacter sp.]